MKIISKNLSQNSETVLLYSSQDVFHPASNIKHEFRSKEWRSSKDGYFNITEELNFELNSVTLTIPEGVYSGSSLGNMVASLSADIVSFKKSNTTGLWTLTTVESELVVSSGSFLHIYCGYAVGNYTGTMHTGSTVAIHTEEFLTFDLRTTEDLDGFVLLWDKDNMRLSPSAKVFVEGNATNEWSNPAYSQELTFQELYQVASLYLSSPQSFRYWRVKIVDRANPYLYVSLGCFIIGKLEDYECPSNGFAWSVSDTSEVTTNSFGNVFVDEYPQINQLSISFDLLTYETANELEQMFKRVGGKKTVWLVLEETGTVFNKDNYAIYGKLAPQLTLNHLQYKYFTSGLTITEVL